METRSERIDRLARETIAGRHGWGQERRERLGADYTDVQARVNELLPPRRPPHPLACALYVAGYVVSAVWLGLFALTVLARSL